MTNGAEYDIIILDKYQVNKTAKIIRKEKQMKLRKRIIAGFLSALFILCSVSLPVAAAADPYTWDGTSVLAADRTYYIKSNITLSKSLTVPAGTVMVLLSGTSVTVPYGITLDIKGRLVADNGASLIINGTLNTYGGSALDIDGTMSASGRSAVSLSGVTLLSDTAQTAFAGTLDVNSDFTSYGEIGVTGTARFSAKSYIGGKLEIRNNAQVINTGAMTLGNDCSYTLKGMFTNSENGSVTDNRRAYDNSAMSVETISLYTTNALTGIDVSWAQGDTIDWTKVKSSGIDFAMIRSSRGRISDDYPMTSDTYFHENMKGAMQNGIPAGVYHYCYAETVEEARDEAKFVLSLISGYEISYPVVFDIEDQWYVKNGYSKQTLTAMTEAFCEEIANAGYLPVVYSYASFFNSYLDMTALSKYPVWVAHVDTDKPAYSGTYFMWQYSWEGSISGIDGNVDMDHCYVDFDAYTRKFGLNGRK